MDHIKTVSGYPNDDPKTRVHPPRKNRSKAPFLKLIFTTKIIEYIEVNLNFIDFPFIQKCLKLTHINNQNCCFVVATM